MYSCVTAAISLRLAQVTKPAYHHTMVVLHDARVEHTSVM